MDSLGAEAGPLAIRPPPIVDNNSIRPGQAARRLANPIRVVAFNAHGGRALESIARRLAKPPLAGAGIILLSEAGWRMRMSAGREFPRELAAMLGMSFAYVPEWGILDDSGIRFDRSIGNAILVDGALEDARSAPILHFPRARLSYLSGQMQGLIATVRIGGAALTIGVVHLDSRVEPARRELQMADFLSAVPEGGPAVIGGDFNTTTFGLTGWGDYFRAAARLIATPRRIRAPQPFEPLFRRMTERGFTVDDANVPGVPTFAASGLIPRPMRPKLDWIAVRGVRAVAGSAAVVSARDSGLGGRRFSDHDFVVCDVSVA